jgi:hypothetical protein
LNNGKDIDNLLAFDPFILVYDFPFDVGDHGISPSKGKGTDSKKDGEQFQGFLQYLFVHRVFSFKTIPLQYKIKDGIWQGDQNISTDLWQRKMRLHGKSKDKRE